MDRSSVFFQLAGMVVLYVLLLLVTFQGYKRIKHQSLTGSVATLVALCCLAGSFICTVVITYSQKGG